MKKIRSRRCGETGETRREGKTYRKSPWRFFFAVTAVLSGGWLAMYAALQRMAAGLTPGMLIGRGGEAASIGIIGGADGPTAVFVTGVSSGPDWDVVLAGAVLVISILAFLRLRRCKGKG